MQLGPTPFLGNELEQEFYCWLIKMACIGYGQSKNELFDRIQVIVKQLKWETKFPNGHPGKQWYCLFLKQFPDLKLQQAQLLSCQCTGISRNALNIWHPGLFEYLEETDNLSVLDELLHVFNTTKVLVGKGDLHVYQQGSSDKSQITVLMMMNAVALYIRLLIVYLGCNFHQTFLENFYVTNFNLKYLSKYWLLFKTKGIFL